MHLEREGTRVQEESWKPRTRQDPVCNICSNVYDAVNALRDVR